MGQRQSMYHTVMRSWIPVDEITVQSWAPVFCLSEGIRVFQKVGRCRTCVADLDFSPFTMDKLSSLTGSLVLGLGGSGSLSLGESKRRRDADVDVDVVRWSSLISTGPQDQLDDGSSTRGLTD